jgi:hypothetical protein
VLPAPAQVMSTLHALAQSGHTVVASIHQPRSSIWSLFDDLVGTQGRWTSLMTYLHSAWPRASTVSWQLIKQ